jgi:hypothetical protein
MQTPWELGKRTGQTKIVGRLLAPLSEEMTGAIRCIGLNYSDHAVYLSLYYLMSRLK